MKKILVSLVLAGFFAVPMAAQAACTLSGEVVRILEYPTYSLVYVKTAPLVPFIFYFQVTNTELRAGARTAMVTGKDIVMYGNAASCPTTGDVRYGGVVISTLVVNP